MRAKTSKTKKPTKAELEQAKKQAEKNLKQTKENMLKVYSEACFKLGRLLKTSELKQNWFMNTSNPKINGQYVSISDKGVRNKTYLHRNGVNHYFVNMENFKKEAMNKFPKKFENVIEHDVYIPKAMAKVEEIVENSQRFIILTAIAEAKPHRRALKALKAYARKKKAKILLIPADNRYAEIHPDFHNDKDIHVIFGNVRLNNSIFISGVKVSPNTVDPLSGLADWTKRTNSSIVVGSPKLYQIDVPNKKGEKPHRMITTGAITEANYKSRTYLSLKKNEKADYDHVLGACIVELENDDYTFYTRQIEFEKNGSFIDLGVRYKADGSTEKIKEAMLVLGDLHSIEKDEMAFRHFIENVAPVLAPAGKVEVAVQDFIDGESISHHDQSRIAKRSALALQKRLSLPKEFKVGAEDLNYITSQKHVSKAVIVPSNHNEFVDRWLDDARWIKDNNNSFMGSIIYPYCIASYIHREHTGNEAVKLIAEHLEMPVEVLKKTLPELSSGKSPVQVGLELYDVKNPQKVKWLKRDEGYMKYGIEFGQHGDTGSGGAKFSYKSAGTFLGKAMVGHSHTATISPNSMIWVVGCLEHLNPEYAKGGSSWSHTSGVAYPNGKRQLLTLIDGKCFLDDKKLK